MLCAGDACALEGFCELGAAWDNRPELVLQRGGGDLAVEDVLGPRSRAASPLIRF